MKKNCRNCHFLTKEYTSIDSDFETSNSFSNVERCEIDRMKANPIKDHYAAKCHMSVWREGATKDPDFYKKVITSNRSNCFFYPYQKGMLFKAAEIMQKRQQDNEHLKRSNMYTRIGLWIAAGALILNVVVNYLSKNT
ncbi:hypothetical protein [Vibrio metschnikovii]|uniref:hypothetical protein n=1 Tax=Vibrio metschnikovii TaxID=28172 RepID=UPI001C310855|nr:hypothetical protein [Vibrio metschnikovii]